MKQRAEITFETEETIVISEGNYAFAFCEGCQKETLLYTPRAASFLTGLTERGIFRLVEAGAIHFTENDRVMVCLDSIKHSYEQPQPHCLNAGDDEPDPAEEDKT